MTPDQTIPARDLDRRSRRRRMAFAFVAGGLVLGVGAAVTLAAWTDNEFVFGDFAGGEFELEGAVAAGAWLQSETSPGQELSFAVGADELAPDAVVYAPFAVQLTADSDYEADVTIQSTITGTIGADLTYSLYEVASFDATCEAGTPPAPGDAIITDSAADNDTPAAVFTLDAVTEPVFLCFAVTAGDIEQSATGTVIWEFVGTSTDPLP